MPTPHNTAQPGDFAKTVLMPGDPVRAKWIADTYLTDAVLVNAIRGVNGYTGAYKGKRVSVMASGMGGPAISIYSYELFSFYGVERIIRVGSAGAIVPELELGCVLGGLGSCYDASLSRQYGLPGTFAPVCSYPLLRRADDCAKQLGVDLKVGKLLCSDVFYGDGNYEKWAAFGVLAVEMESAALYLNAARTGKEALCLCTVSDNLVTHAELTPEERQSGFKQMMEVALETAY